eukprot:GHVR01004475.1.p1 GENE.GHVR01004475.1~~GHVR01004475.1.p1  ORF type:complete len:466 (-),score=92.46 GHVR01004475.1:182-1579(-)
MYSFYKRIFIFLITFIIRSASGVIFINENIIRTYETQVHVVIFKYNIVAKNISSTNGSVYELIFLNNISDQLGYLNAYDYNENIQLNINVGERDDKGLRYYITLLEPIQPSSVVQLYIVGSIGHGYIPIPKYIPTIAYSQNEHQRVQFEESYLFYSAYLTRKQVTYMNLPKMSFVERVVPTKYGVQKGLVIAWKEEVNTPPYTHAGQYPKIGVHMVLPVPLPFITRLQREIQVSHWGAVSFHESGEIINAGASPSTEFNRGEMNRVSGWVDTTLTQGGGTKIKHHNLLSSYSAQLPLTAENIKYYDFIGNITTSNAYRTKDSTMVVMSPRYYLLGGWKADVQLSYNVPTEAVLSRKSTDTSIHILNVTFTHPFHNLHTDELEVSVVLPAGAHDVQVVLPRNMNEDTLEFKTKWGWFDLLTPRPAVFVTAKNVFVPGNEVLTYNMQVVYRFWGYSFLLLVGVDLQL